MRAAILVLFLPVAAGISSSSKEHRILHPHPDVETYATSKCGFHSHVNFQTWFENLSTDSPVLFPRNEDALTDILRKTKNNGCRLRVRGAGHSEDGVVMQRQDDNVVAVNLKRFKPVPSWDGVITSDKDGNGATIRISAGASLLEMISTVRPQGWLPVTSYPLPSFSVAGAYLNPATHGQTYGAGRLASQVTGFRVLLANGTIQEYVGDDPRVLDLRGSMGLLGIVTALEIRLRRDTGMVMRRDKLQIGSLELQQDYQTSFNETSVRQFLTRKLQENNGTDFFYHPQEDLLVTFELHFDEDTSFDPTSTREEYEKKLAKFPDLAFTGGTQTDFTHLIGVVSDFVYSTKDLAVELGKTVRQGAETQFDDNAMTLRDGFWVEPDHVNGVEIIFYSVRCQENQAAGTPICLDELIHLFRSSREFLLRLQDTDDSDWYPTFPLEWRLFTVGENEMTLEHLSPGTYIGFENLALRADDSLVFSKYHKQLEEMWRRDFPGGGIHHGKQYGYAAEPGTIYEANEWYPPFQNDTILDAIYTDSVKATFRNKMALFDPEGDFQAGSVLRLLELSQDKFLPLREPSDVRDLLEYVFLPKWTIVLEFILFGLIAAVPCCSYWWYRRTRLSICAADSFCGLQRSSMKSDCHSLPLLFVQGFRLAWKGRGRSGSVIDADRFWLGGCKLTALKGRSGAGKSSLVKLLAGYKATHMELSSRNISSSCPIVLCPQTPDMWPAEMPVRDVLLFANVMYGSDPREAADLLRILGISEFLDRTFGKLSGGQMRMVSIAAAIVRPTPTLILLDEPFAHLDKASALKLVRALKTIPNHSFVITAHMLHQSIYKEFDRTVVLGDDEDGMGSRLDFESMELSAAETDPTNATSIDELKAAGHKGEDYLGLEESATRQTWNAESSASETFRGIKAMLVMWHAQCYGKPVIELALVSVSVLGAVLFGALVRGPMTGDNEFTDISFIPYVKLAGIPLLYSGILSGIGLNTIFTLPLMYNARESKVVAMFVAQRSLKLNSLVVVALLRSICLGLLQTLCWLLVFLPMTTMWGSTTPELMVNTVVYASAWGIFTTTVATIVPPTLGPHTLVLLNAYAGLLAGCIVPFGYLSQFMKALHYLSPLFYFTISGAALVLYDIHTGCDHGWSVQLPEDVMDITPGSFFDIVREGICASGYLVMDSSGSPPISSAQAQTAGLVLTVLSAMVLWISLKRYRGAGLACGDAPRMATNKEACPAATTAERERGAREGAIIAKQGEISQETDWL